MLIKYKLIVIFVLVIIAASLPLSLFILNKQKAEKIKSLIHTGGLFSKILSRSTLNIILMNGGDIESIKVDAKDMIAILDTLSDDGLIYADSILLSSKKEYNGIVLARFNTISKSKIFSAARFSDEEISPLLSGGDFREITVPEINDVCYEFISTGALPGKVPLCIGRLIFSKSLIIEPVMMLQRVIYTSTIVAILIVSLLGFILSRRFISGPISNLKKATETIEGGNFAYQIPVTSKDELGALSHTFNSMSRIISLKIEELETTNRRLTQLDRLKDEFLTNISHELRTPLYGIIGIVDSLIDGSSGRFDDEILHDLSLVSISGRRLAALVNDLLDFSKLKHSDIPLALEPVNLYNIAQYAISIIHYLVRAKPIKIENRIGHEMFITYGDGNRLQQIFLNIVGNAVKFTDSGEITLSAGFEGENDNIIRVSIKDTGIGIKAEDISRIFESFEQLEGSIDRVHGGTGLGLAITRKLIELHGGTISVESVPGEGSEFHFTLPRYSIAEMTSFVRPDQITADRDILSFEYAESDIVDKGGQIEGDEAYIVVVDDEPVNVRVLVSQLGIEGYKVDSVNSGPELFDLIIESGVPDLILLDVMLPKMPGYDICRKLREEYSSHILPIVMLTAKTKPADIVNGLKAGANDYLSKPVEREELVARVKNLISMKKSVKIQGELEILRSELILAREIQSTIMPGEPPIVDGLEIAMRYVPMKEVGGDFYDFHVIENRRLGILVADVVGHGIPAAMVSAMLEVTYSFHKSDKLEPSDLFNRINAGMSRHTHGLYLTALYVRLDIDRKMLSYVNAGHRPLFIWRKYDQHLVNEENFQRPIGVFIDSTYTINEVEIMDGDRLFLYTDGIVEAKNAKNEEFGVGRFTDIIKRIQDMRTDEAADFIIAAVREWVPPDEENLGDDITLIVIDVSYYGKIT